MWWANPSPFENCQSLIFRKQLFPRRLSSFSTKFYMHTRTTVESHLARLSSTYDCTVWYLQVTASWWASTGTSTSTCNNRWKTGLDFLPCVLHWQVSLRRHRYDMIHNTRMKSEWWNFGFAHTQAQSTLNKHWHSLHKTTHTWIHSILSEPCC